MGDLINRQSICRRWDWSLLLCAFVKENCNCERRWVTLMALRWTGVYPYEVSTMLLETISSLWVCKENIETARISSMPSYKGSEDKWHYFLQLCFAWERGKGRIRGDIWLKKAKVLWISKNFDRFPFCVLWKLYALLTFMWNCQHKEHTAKFHMGKIGSVPKELITGEAREGQ